MYDNNNSLPENILKTIEIESKLKESTSQMTELQNHLQTITSPYSQIISSLGHASASFTPLIKTLNQSEIVSTFKSMVLRLSTPPLDFIKKTTDLSVVNAISASIKGILKNYATVTEILSTPALDWFRSIGSSLIAEKLKQIPLDPEIYLKYKKLNNIYLKTMYETKWFPYAGWIADTSLFMEINDIIHTSRGASKNREKRIDKAILSYYTNEEVLHIKKSWQNSNLDCYIRKILIQAIDAYLRGEYALTIPCLSTMWEGLIYVKAKNVSLSKRKRQPMGETKQEFKTLVRDNNYEAIFSDYFDNWIVSNCNAVDDVIDGVPNRHGVAHSWYKKYPDKKTALNAILLTDFIINLTPVEQSEEE